MTDPEFSVPRRSGDTRRRRTTQPRAGEVSNEQIVATIRRWHDTYGEAPRVIDWDPSRARRADEPWRAERFEAGEWPTAKTVIGRFASFNAAVQAAGLTPRPAPSRRSANLSGPGSITAAMLEWTRRYGDIPTMADWDPARARRLGQDWRIARYHTGDWPSARSVALHFGSFAEAAQAAGLVPRPVGVHHQRRLVEREANRLVAGRASAEGRRPGVDQLVAHVRAVAQARRDQDPVSTHVALVDLAGAALAWAEALDG